MIAGTQTYEAVVVERRLQAFDSLRQLPDFDERMKQAQREAVDTRADAAAADGRSEGELGAYGGGSGGEYGAG